MFCCPTFNARADIIRIAAWEKRTDVSFLMSSFHVSKKAAIKRLDTMHKLNTDFRSKDERDFDE